MKNLINWKLFFILVTACAIASVLVIPYQVALTSADLKSLPFPLPVMLLITLIQNFILFGILTFFGLFFSDRIRMGQTGLGLPIMENILNGKNQSKEFKEILIPSVVFGIISGVLIIAASIPFNSLIPELSYQTIEMQPWKGFLASFYGGIAEEVMLRLFLMSFVLWLILKLNKNKEKQPTIFEFWFSIIFCSVIFGIGHLPATANIVPLSALVVTRAIVLNSIGGVIFGYLYWKKGLESAIIAHFTTDIVLHVISPLIVSLITNT